jgi:alkanesulfonate monooxygenase SsuD/methylene tetrahydromethanopterin reductase-like flavin-dependent oxidoreductase (luciferase family)
VNCSDTHAPALLWSLVAPGQHARGMEAFAVESEAAGFHRVWTTEMPGREPIVRATRLLASTSTLRAGTGIAYAFTRHPIASASAAAEAHALSGGRFALGLGSGTRGQRRWYGEDDWDRPAARLRDHFSAVRTLLHSKGKAEYAGEFYQFRIPRWQPGSGDAALEALELYGSGLQRVMLRELSAVCDGIALHPFASAPAYLDDVVLPAVAEGAKRGGRQHPKLTVWCPVSVDEDPTRARARAAQQLAFYFSTPSYEFAAIRAGFSADVRRLLDAAPRENHDFAALSRFITDDLLDTFAVHGTPEQVTAALRKRASAWRERGIVEVALQITPQGLSEADLHASIAHLHSIPTT